jgi:hypothetical protein
VTGKNSWKIMCNVCSPLIDQWATLYIGGWIICGNSDNELYNTWLSFYTLYIYIVDVVNVSGRRTCWNISEYAIAVGCPNGELAMHGPCTTAVLGHCLVDLLETSTPSWRWRACLNCWWVCSRSGETLFLAQCGLKVEMRCSSIFLGISSKN